MTTIVDYALLAGDSYYDTRNEVNRFPVPQDWILLSRIPENKSSGFEASAYKNGTEVVISFAGTDPSDFTGDIFTDLALATGALCDQLRQAAEYYLAVKASMPVGTKITLTGHSLGGGFVRKEQPVKLKFATFPFQKYGMVEGVVDYVSADSADGNSGAGAVSDDKTSAKPPALVYKALVSLKRMSLEMDGERFALGAGMQTSAEIMLGTRTVMEYLLSPVRKAWHEAGRER